MIANLKICIIILTIITIGIVAFLIIKNQVVESFQDKPIIDNNTYIKKTMSYNKVWYNKTKDYTIWEPESIGDYYPLGHIIANGTKIPILHTAEIIDWYTGGPKPKVLENL